MHIETEGPEGAVDLVLLVESPGAVSRGLQRVGRAGHHVGDVSRGRLFLPSLGRRWLCGPGSIRLAHTEEERIERSDLERARELYRSWTVERLGVRAAEEASS